MKHLYITALFSSTALFGGGFIAPPADINLSRPATFEAKYLYEAGKYKEALLSAETDTKHYADPRLHHIWAESAKALGKMEEAMSAYERVLILSPGYPKIQTTLVDIYRRSGREELAEQMEGKQTSTQGLTTNIGIAYGYDDNINANPGQQTLDEYYNLVAGTSPDTISSQVMNLTANANYSYHLKSAPSWKLGGKLSLYHQSTFEDHQYDMMIGSAILNASYRRSIYRLSLPVHYNYVHYLDTHLMNKYSFLPMLLISVTPKNHIGVQAIFSQGNFVDNGYSNRDAKTLGASLSYYYQLTANDLLTSSVKYEQQEAETKSDEKYVDVTFKTLNLSWKHAFSKEWSLKSDYMLRQADYEDDIDPTKAISADLREDTLHQLNIMLSYSYNEAGSLYLRGQHTLIDANYMPAEYRKNLWLIGTTINF